jgi:TRAP-type C4-dicarboxylate transport system substrate-binding protein
MHEVAKHYTVVGWGSTSIYQMSVNLGTWNKLPAEVRKIFEEEAKNWEVQTADEATRRFEDSLQKLKEGGTTVQVLPMDERRKLAEALGAWPDEMAKKFDGDGLPGSKLFRRYLDIAEQSGVKPAYKYVIK